MTAQSPSGLNSLLILLIQGLHVAFILWYTIAPFTHSPPMLVLHAITGPFLWLHWALSADGCFLTLVEKKLRGVDNDQSFFHNLLSPIYLLNGIKDCDIKRGVMIASVLLWLVTVHKLIKHPEYWKQALWPGCRSKTPEDAADRV